MKTKLFLLIAFTAVLASAKTVYLNGYGSDFNVSDRIAHLQPGESLTFHSDDPGRLVLRLNEDGAVTMAANAGDDITFTAAQLQGVHSVRCSFIDYQGTLQGWEATHDDRYGSDPTFPNAAIAPNHPWVLAALIALGLI